VKPIRNVSDKWGPVRRRSDALRALASSLVVGGAVIIGSAVARGDSQDIAWVVAVLAVTWLVIAVTGRWALSQRVLTMAVGTYLAVLAVATISASLGWFGAPVSGRVALFTGNPNALGAALVTALTAWVGVSSDRARLAWAAWPVVGLAVLQTGSRTAAIGLAAGFMAWVLRRMLRSDPGVARWAVTASVVLGAILAAVWQLGVVERTVNLVQAPHDLGHPVWTVAPGTRIEVDRAATEGPMPGTRAQRISGVAGEARNLVVMQTIEIGRPGVPYVASLYLRSDTPQRIILGTRYTRTTCEVTTEWQRCITTPEQGDGSLTLRYDIRVPSAGGAFDVYVFGPQVERAWEASPFVAPRAWLPPALVSRFDLRAIGDAPNDRTEAHTAALRLWRARPWIGYGREDARARMIAETARGDQAGITHAHNTALQLLLEDGLFGLLAWLVVVGGIARFVPRGERSRLAPMVIALFVLNTWDATLFGGGGFYPMVVGVAVIAGKARTTTLPTGSTEEPNLVHGPPE